MVSLVPDYGSLIAQLLLFYFVNMYTHTHTLTSMCSATCAQMQSQMQCLPMFFLLLITAKRSPETAPFMSQQCLKFIPTHQQICFTDLRCVNSAGFI